MATVESPKPSVSEWMVRPWMFRYFILGLFGLFLTWFCNLQENLISKMFVQPSVLLDPMYVIRVFGTFFRQQLVNSTTRAVVGTFLLAVGSLTIINCRVTPGSMGRRLGFHYLGLNVAIAFGFPLQCGLYEHPKEAPADIVLLWLSTLIAAGIGGYGLFVDKSDGFIAAWYFIATTVVPVIYEPFIFKLGAQSKSRAPYQVLAIVSFGAQVFLWLPVLQTRNFKPFATWCTCSIFWDLVVVCLCAATWVLQYTGSYFLALVTLVSPGTGLPLAMAELSHPAAKETKESKAE